MVGPKPFLSIIEFHCHLFFLALDQKWFFTPPSFIFSKSPIASQRVIHLFVLKEGFGNTKGGKISFLVPTITTLSLFCGTQKSAVKKSLYTILYHNSEKSLITFSIACPLSIVNNPFTFSAKNSLGLVFFIISAIA